MRKIVDNQKGFMANSSPLNRKGFPSFLVKLWWIFKHLSDQFVLAPFTETWRNGACLQRREGGRREETADWDWMKRRCNKFSINWSRSLGIDYCLLSLTFTLFLSAFFLLIQFSPVSIPYLFLLVSSLSFCLGDIFLSLPLFFTPSAQIFPNFINTSLWHSLFFTQ